MQGYQIEAQVLRDRIQAELAKVELFRAQLEGERVRGEVNEQRVRLYAEQIRSVNLMADFYRTQVEAVKVKADAQRMVFDRYKTAMDGFDTLWRAHVSEWNGFTASVEGESKRADLFRTLVDAHSKRVDGWATGESLKLDRERLRTQQHGQSLDSWRALLAKRESELDIERSRLAVVSTYVDSQARLYSASASVEQAASAASDRSFELGLSRSRARMEAGSINANLMLQQAKHLTDQLLSIRDTKAKIAAQLTASSWSAVNYSAGVSASTGQNQSCNTSFNFNGDPVLEDVNLWQVLLQGAGFSPAKIAERYERNRALKNYEEHITGRRQSLMNAYAMAIRNGDAADRAAVMEKILSFNKTNPEVAISSSSIRTSMKSRARYSANAEGGIVLNPKLSARLNARVGTAE